MEICHIKTMWCKDYRITQEAALTAHLLLHGDRVLSIGRSIACRRFLFLIGTLYLYRCVTMYITTLPVPGMHMTCAPKVSGNKTSEKHHLSVSRNRWAQPRKRSICLGKKKKSHVSFHCLGCSSDIDVQQGLMKTCVPGSCLLGWVQIKRMRGQMVQ